MSCDICADRFNKSTHAPVKCPYCPLAACTTCSERYLLDTTEDAHCMGCRKAWSREILSLNFTNKFVSQTYKMRRENLLMEREKSLMPATQPYVEYEKQSRSLTKDIEKINGIIHVEQVKLNQLAHGTALAPFAVAQGVSTEWEASVILNKLLTEKRKVVSALMLDITHLEWIRQQLLYRMTGSVLSHTERREFVRACPVNNCRGFLSTAWKCGLCENWTCPTCHEVKGPNKDIEHTCDAGNVATAALLAKDSRNCPKCAALIFKINGCDQMYCTQCHTPFSWRTGRIETGTVHNPHYYEYQRRNGTLPRQPGDIPCGGFPQWGEIIRIVPRGHPDWTWVSSAFRSHAHCQFAVLPRYTINGQNENRDLRVKLMIGDYTEEDFKKKIQQREKARQKKNDIRQVLEMYMAVIADLFQAFAQDRGIPMLRESLTELRDHVNTTMKQISKRYTNCAVPTISTTFDMN